MRKEYTPAECRTTTKNRVNKISRKKYAAGYTFLRKIRNLRGEIN